MFSVPGWNVSAPIAAQVEQPKPQDPNKLGKKAQKRKRAQEEQVNTEDLGKLWEKAEAQKTEAPKVEAPKKEASKKEVSKDSDLPARALQRAAEDDAEAAAEGEKKNKKRKRGPRKNAAMKEAAAAKAAEAGATEGNAVPAGPKVADPDSKRSKKKQKKEHKAEKAERAEKAEKAENAETPSSKPVEIPALMDPVALIPEPAGLTPLQKTMRSKLASARFRHLNESLYTKPSADSLSLFTDDPSMFEDYHRGFAQQVEVWPQNPVDDYVESILKRGSIKIAKDPWRAQMREQKKKGPVVSSAPETDASHPIIPRGNNKPLPRVHGGKCLIADLGCGVASLSYRLQPHLSTLNISIHSFDLSQPSGPSKSLVTVADISSLPLKENSTDIAIFCLALMGTNWLDFIDEAYRILRWKGELWIAEIKSRFGRVEKKKNKIPINSIGSLHKGSKPPKKKPSSGGAKEKKKDDVEGIEDSADEAELAQAVDGATGPEGTDVSSFISVLASRGFVLDALPERPGDAIDLSNKMFVKLQFVKGAQPTKGKNAGTEGTSAGARGSFKTSSALKMGIKGKKFSAVKDDEEEKSGLKDGEVLKPCLYKIR